MTNDRNPNDLICVNNYLTENIFSYPEFCLRLNFLLM
jgi:hypothetical protein